MRLMVTGANGQVGWELDRSLAALGSVVALDRRQCDLSRPERNRLLVRLSRRTRAGATISFITKDVLGGP